MHTTHSIIRKPDFTSNLRHQLDRHLYESRQSLGSGGLLKIDLHCHDHNSDVPDDLWGRLLGLPETWLKTECLVNSLVSRQCDVITITNHNNARSCWTLLERGIDVLVGAEFTCYMEEYDLYLHVLTYGFTPQQEEVLQVIRKDIRKFLRYTAENNLLTILPHPLYFYSRKQHFDLELFEKLAVMFQHFEVLNGQRNLWQNALVLSWINTLSPDKIIFYGKKHNMCPAEFGVNPHRPKILTAGSDDHTGLYAGTAGVLVEVPVQQPGTRQKSKSELALEALRAGNLAPFGNTYDHEKLTIGILDYFSHCATRIEEPGLLRMLMHRGSLKDKIGCFAVGNILSELKSNNLFNRNFTFLVDALRGKRINPLARFRLSKEYRFLLQHLDRIAHASGGCPDQFTEVVLDAIEKISTESSLLIVKKLQDSDFGEFSDDLGDLTIEELIKRLEVPIQISEWLAKDSGGLLKMMKSSDKSLKALSKPVSMAGVILGVIITSTRVLYKNREFLHHFSHFIGAEQHPNRALHLTDTLHDRNGVSNSLRGKLKEIQATGSPIDFLLCHPGAHSEPHLKVLRPIFEFTSTVYANQPIRIPNPLEVINLFYEGRYDRIVCSTEGPMALLALLLKYMFNVEAYFFMHTDWIEFIRHNTQLDEHHISRIRRIFRSLYEQFDAVFVLNSDHKRWLIEEMGLDESRVKQTAHHTKPKSPNIKRLPKSDFFDDANENTPILLYVGRLSKEKRIFEMVSVLERVRKVIPDIRLVIAGTGPDEARLKTLLPDAKFLGWVSPDQLASCYLSLDLFVFPSKFDTFGNVILEANTYGMPVVGYNCRGPKDLIIHKETGFLADNVDEFCAGIIQYFFHCDRDQIKANAAKRAQSYRADKIMKQFINLIGLNDSEPEPQKFAEDLNQSVA